MATTSFFVPRRPPKPTARPAAPARAEADALSASAARVTWLDQSTNERGFRIDVAEQGRRFKPVATAAPNATAVVVPDLKADTPYTFRVSALGNAGSKSAAAVTSGEPLTLELMSGDDPLDTAGWFKFTLPAGSTPTPGEAGFTAEGFLLSGTGWYYGSNWRDAALVAITGTVRVTDPSTSAAQDWSFPAGPYRVGTGTQLKAQVEAEVGPTFDLVSDNTKLVVLDDQWVSPDRDYDDFYWEVEVEKLTVVDVKWVPINSPLDPNTQQNGGQRMFPDKNTETDTVARDTVTVEATLSHAIPSGQNIPVYFRSYDPDDPYPDSTGEIDDNGIADLDNNGTTPGQRGTFPAAGINYGTSALANTAGVASVTFKVTMQPGDNFRIGAAFVNAELDPLDSRNNLNAVPADNTQVASFPGKLTDLLTVWRRLWVERDVMLAGPANSVGVTITGVTANVPQPGFAGANDVVQLNGRLPDSADAFEGGTLTLAGGLTIQIYKNSDNDVFSDTLNVPAGSFPAGTTFPINATVTDDDTLRYIASPTNTTLPLASGGTLIDSAFGNAYIKPIYVDPGPLNTTPTVPFLRHLGTNWQAAAASRDLTTSEAYWTTLLVSCFEDTLDDDADPDGGQVHLCL